MWWPAILVAAAVAALVLFLRSEAGRERRRGALVVAGLAAVVSIVGVMPLMGIPGAVVYELSAPWVQSILGEGYAELGDGAWPAAIVMTLAWPSSIVLAYVIACGPLRRRSGWLRWPVLILFPYAAAVSLALWAHLAAR
jgi:hypothetical protein